MQAQLWWRHTASALLPARLLPYPAKKTTKVSCLDPLLSKNYTKTLPKWKAPI